MKPDDIPEETWRLASGPFGEEMAKLTRSYPVPLFWPVDPNSKGAIDDEIRHGTTFFLDCGEGAFGVTAGHVYDAAEKHATAGSWCQIGLGPPSAQKRYDLRERLIARGKHTDIATYRMSPDEIVRTSANVLRGSQRDWPPSPPKKGDAVLFAGYPGVDRKVARPGTISFGTYNGGGLVDSVSDRYISSQIRHEFMIELPGFEIPRPGYPTAGMSGAPMLLIERGTVLAWRLAGVVCDGGWDLLEFLQAARADFICPDGTLSE